MTLSTNGDVLGYSVKIWDSIDDIDAAAWNEVSDLDDVFMDLRMLRVMASTMADTSEFGFVLVYDENRRPVAATCLWKVLTEGTLLARDSVQIRLTKFLAKIVPALNYHRILFCGMPVSAGQSNLRFAPGSNHERIMAALTKRLEAIARAEHLRYIVFKEFDDSQIPFMSSLADLGYHRADSLPMNEFASPHGSFQEYLASLKTHKRSHIKNTTKKLERGGLKLHVTSDPTEIDVLYSDKVHRLYEAVLGRSEARLETLPPGFFRGLAHAFHEDCQFCFLMDGDVVRAFGVVLFSRRVAYTLYVGVDYEKNEEHSLYFNTMYAMLAQSLTRKVQLINWGQTADDFKRSKLSCYQTARYIYLKGTTMYARALIGWQFQHLFPERKIASRPVIESRIAERKAA